MHEPKTYHSVMVSSTFTDLEAHRDKLIQALHRFGLMASAMEHAVPRAGRDVIDSSLQMVRDAAAYIGVISRKYGQTLLCPDRNPNNLSITELEFNEAMRLERPILLFIMGEKHPLIEADIELDPEKRKKLDAFRERAKRMHAGSPVHRVYQIFNSLEDFATAATAAVGQLAPSVAPSAPRQEQRSPPTPDNLLRPPAFLALPKYLGSHRFVGRAAELQTLSDWCAPADPNPMLLFEAIGGSGKSMLTWEFITNHAPNLRHDCAGRFWYSFYEKGADMSGFCRHALAYITEKPVEEFNKLRTAQLATPLLAELERRPFLLVLDGLERILVAYHRLDAAELRDDEVDTATDQIFDRNPRRAIRLEDDEFLPRLAAAAPSKILVSSRLTPIALVNKSDQPIPNVRRELLRGLRPPDAELMLRACGVRGKSADIQAYLQTNCDCHPLIIGALAGLINKYRPDPGAFDRWSNDPNDGAKLNLAELDLVQRRNHILAAAIDSVPPAFLPLLQTLSLLPGGAEFETLAAILHTPPASLTAPIDALESSGLLQYDAHECRYDLHPVVRGIALGRMAPSETEAVGGQLVDHFNSQPHSPWEEAETPADVEPGLRLVQTLLRLKQHQEAFRAFRGDLADALLFNLAANSTMQALLKQFFPSGWHAEPISLDNNDLAYLFNEVAWALDGSDRATSWRMHERHIALNIELSDAPNLGGAIRNIANVSLSENRLAEGARLPSHAFALAEVTQDATALFMTRLFLFGNAVDMDNYAAADHLWQDLERMGRGWPRARYRPGDAELWHARNLFHRGELNETHLGSAQTLAALGRNRQTIQDLHLLRGLWHLSRNEPALAIIALAEAARLAAEAGGRDVRAEALHAIARLRTRNKFDAHAAAESLGDPTDAAALYTAELWHELNAPDRAIAYALRAHLWAAADGEPYVHRYELNRTRALLSALGARLPEIPTYDPTTAKIYPWEAQIQAFIEKLRAERATKQMPP